MDYPWGELKDCEGSRASCILEDHLAIPADQAYSSMPNTALT